jgi:dihydropteroate synthase
MAEDFQVMGVVNVTPDSFSDGGLFSDARAAVQHGRQLVHDGADILDVGGESTRPGADPVGLDEELRRVIPVVEALAADGHAVSVDTSKAAVAERALAAGASLVNDVTALRADERMVEVVASADCRCCLMHMRGEPRTMQDAPRYGDVVGEVAAFLLERIAFAGEHGIAAERLLVDPGIGFGKTVRHNLELLAGLPRIVALGPPVLVGTSRKGFLGTLVSGPDRPLPPPDERLAGTIATNVLAFERGARVFRVHDVAAVHDALTIAAATLAP